MSETENVTGNVALDDLTTDEAEQMLNQKKVSPAPILRTTGSVMTETEIHGLLTELDYECTHTPSWSYPSVLKTNKINYPGNFYDTDSTLETMRFIEDTVTAVDETTQSIRDELSDKSAVLLEEIKLTYTTLHDEIKSLRQEIADSRAIAAAEHQSEMLAIAECQSGVLAVMNMLNRV